MPISRCLKCAGDIIPSGMGRPPKWCSTLCRQRGNRMLRRLRRELADAQAAGLERRDPSWPPA